MIYYKNTSMHRANVFLIFLLLLSNSFESLACSCAPYPNRSLCQLGEEASAGQLANFMAVVELPNATNTENPKIFPVDIIEMLSGERPSGNINLLQYGSASCGQQRIIGASVRGVLIANLVDGKASPNVCLLRESFFRMSGDTVFIPLFDERGRGFDQPYTLEQFRTNTCINFSSSKEVLPADESFNLTYTPQSSMLEVISLDPAIRTENVRVDIYSSNGQHLLEAQPASPIDMRTMPPGMYSILIRDEQRAWSKAFVKPN